MNRPPIHHVQASPVSNELPHSRSDTTYQALDTPKGPSSSPGQSWTVLDSPGQSWTVKEKGNIRVCAVRESNPGHLVGNEIFYH
ncbi:hypothetical protein PC116_g32668 [Phytophthora cactorum]|nr:hypothetical protein PC116_g32668 [Phytophthora cactorum]